MILNIEEPEGKETESVYKENLYVAASRMEILKVEDYRDVKEYSASTKLRDLRQHFNDVKFQWHLYCKSGESDGKSIEQKQLVLAKFMNNELRQLVTSSRLYEEQDVNELLKKLENKLAAKEKENILRTK